MTAAPPALPVAHPLLTLLVTPSVLSSGSRSAAWPPASRHVRYVTSAGGEHTFAVTTFIGLIRVGQGRPFGPSVTVPVAGCAGVSCLLRRLSTSSLRSGSRP